VTPGVKDESLISATDKKLDSVRELAINKLLASLNGISDDKLNKLKATELAQVASNMSKVVDSSAKKDKGTGVDRIIVFAPEQKTETHYTTIEVHTP
jgi:hypothetical protein